MTATRDLLRDERIWTMAARVAPHDGQTDHFEYTDEGHIMVSVRTLRHDIPLWAIYRGGDDAGTGVWYIPSLGSEVMLNFDGGEFEGDAYIVAVIGEAPTGLVVDKVYVLGPEVQVRSVGGTAQSLAFQEKLNALEDKVNSLITKHNSHTHILAIAAAAGAGGTGTAAITTTTETAIDSSTGTSVIKGE